MNEPQFSHSEDCERCEGDRWVTSWTEEDGQDDYLCWCIEAIRKSELCDDCCKVNVQP